MSLPSAIDVKGLDALAIAKRGGFVHCIALLETHLGVALSGEGSQNLKSPAFSRLTSGGSLPISFGDSSVDSSTGTSRQAVAPASPASPSKAAAVTLPPSSPPKSPSYIPRNLLSPKSVAERPASSAGDACPNCQRKHRSDEEQKACDALYELHKKYHATASRVASP